MKKLIATLITCIILVLATNYLTHSDSLRENIINNIELEEMPESEIVNRPVTYWYNTLSERQKKMYRIIASGINNLDTNIVIEYSKNKNVEYARQNLEEALNAFFADNPDVFYVNDKYEISMTNLLIMDRVELKLDYITNDAQEVQRMKEQLNLELERINTQLAKCKTDYEKELMAHDILAKEIVYYEHDAYDEIPSLKHTAYSALVEKSAVCDGITKAFQMILGKNNIQSIFVTGMTDNVPHAWCKVKLSDHYYNVDVTSDKVLNKEDKDLVIHSYFNVTDEEIMKSHDFDNYEKLPKSQVKTYNYFEYNDYVISYLDNFKHKMGQIVNKQANSKLLEFSAFQVNDVPSKMVESLYELNFKNYKQNKIIKVEYNQINDNYIIVK